MTTVEYKIRTAVILTILLAWAGIAAAKVYHYSVGERQMLLKKSHPIAWRQAKLPARRGRILDRDGVVLAEDVFCCDLLLFRLPKEKERRKNLLKKLRVTAGEAEHPENLGNLPAVWRKNLTAEEIAKFTRIFRGYPEIHTAGRLERRYNAAPIVQKQLGETIEDDEQKRYGISGLELKYDRELSGRDGKIRVMRDRNGSWIYETLQVIRQPKNGRDVRLDKTLAELEKEGERDHGDPGVMAGN